MPAGGICRALTPLLLLPPPAQDSTGEVDNGTPLAPLVLLLRGVGMLWGLGPGPRLAMARAGGREPEEAADDLLLLLTAE